MGLQFSHTYFPPLGVTGIVTLILGSWGMVLIRYLAVVLPFVRSVKHLEQLGLREAAENIPLANPTLPRSKIYCGEKAFYTKKDNRIILYSEIAWVYIYERTTYGITVEKTAIFRMKNGKQYSLQITTDDLSWLLNTIIAPNSPQLLVGYKAEHKARYEQMYPQARERTKKAMRIWGIVLMCIGGGLLIPGIINLKPETIIALIFLAVTPLIIGLVLFFRGRKN